MIHYYGDSTGVDWLLQPMVILGLKNPNSLCKYTRIIAQFEVSFINNNFQLIKVV